MAVAALAVAILVALSAAASGFEVIGAGLGKSGTSSLRKALQILGYEAMSSSAFGMADSWVWDRWLAVVRNGTGSQDFHQVIDFMTFNRLNAVVDEPTAIFTLELLDKFPDAKVILTTRESPMHWFRSLQRECTNMFLLTFLPHRRLVGSFLRAKEAWMTEIFACTYAREEHAEACMAAYEQHNLHIRENVPASQLLDFQVTDGWEPLCRFLNKSIPEMDFPHRRPAEVQLGTQVYLLLKVLFEYFLLFGLPFHLFLCAVCSTQWCHRIRGRLHPAGIPGAVSPGADNGRT